jgi:dihydroorotate dehydrogenase electron transfer subunit
MAQQFLARVIDSEMVMSANALVRLAVPASVATATSPGQFLMLGSGGRDPLLPRPYSILRVNRAVQGEADGSLDLLVFTGGRGGLRLGDARPGDAFPALGPLGNGFTLGERVRRVLLIAVGHGVAPLIALAEQALAKGIEVVMLVGAQGANSLLPLTYLPEEAEIVVATADGSRGHHGAVVELVPNYLEWADAICAYAPEATYAALRDVQRAYRGARTLPPVQAAMERSMACGMGVCLGCVIETTSGLRTVCRDGPVFPIEKLVLG